MPRPFFFGGGDACAASAKLVKTGRAVTPAVTSGMMRRMTFRIGAVSFLNAKPLIYGLEEQPDLSLSLQVPSRLLAGLERGDYDVALLPVIDYARTPALRLLTAGGICCDGPTLTVRIFSRTAIDRISSLACDADSHTSVALARIILAETYDIRPEFTELRPGGPTADAMLLIGDKVVRDEPPRGHYPHQLDLGEAWKNLTGLPFVFAAWMARPGVDLEDLPDRLQQAKRMGLAHIAQIIERHAETLGWPTPLAHQYLTQYLQFDITDKHLEAIQRFHALAAKHRVL
jgi:chorismate dehydratase